MGALAIVFIPQAGFDPPGEKWPLCLNIVIALPPSHHGWIDRSSCQSGKILSQLNYHRPLLSFIQLEISDLITA